MLTSIIDNQLKNNIKHNKKYIYIYRYLYIYIYKERSVYVSTQAELS